MTDAIGTQDQGSATTDYNAATFHIQQEIEKISTSARVKIVRGPYDKDGNDIPKGANVALGFLDVQPLVNQIDGRGNATPHGTVYRLSYYRAQGGGNAIIVDPEVGDVGTMVVEDRDTSSVRATGKQANPGSRRKYDKADGVYMGRTHAGQATQWFTFTATGFEIHDKNGNSIISGPNGVLINGCLIDKNGDVTTKHGTSLDHHVNTNVTTGGDNTGPPP